MTLTVSFRDRLSSVLAAAALQAALLALLVLSFEAVRHVSQEKETLLTLPPLARPAPLREPVVIDARRKPPPSAGAPPLTLAPLPLYALPGQDFRPRDNAILESLGRYMTDCDIGRYGDLNASARKTCPPPEGLARRDDEIIPLNPGQPAKNAPIWQAEVDRRNEPPSLPGASRGLIGLLGTLLFNPGAYLDKRNYSYAGQDPPKIDGEEYIHQYWMRGSGCPELDDTTKTNCQRNLAVLGIATGPMNGPILFWGAPEAQAESPRVHSSDADFKNALAAYQARLRSLYGKPEPASGEQTGGVP